MEENINDEIEVTMCKFCGDSFIVTDDVLGNYGDMWWETTWECLNCHKDYNPLDRYLNTYPFVFEAFRTVKM